MDMLTLFFRTILTYFIVFIMLRLMGKREIGKLSVFDLVISIMIAEIAVFVIEDTDKPLLDGIIPMVTLVGIQILIAYITLKSLWLRKAIDGVPSIIIDNGKIQRDEMKRQRYNLNDLMLQLRQNHVTDVDDVAFAILETTGKLTVVKKKDFHENHSERHNQPNVQNLQWEASEELVEQQAEPRVRYEGLPLPLIMDGKVLDKNLEKIGRDRFWLKNQIQLKGAKDFKEIFFCTIDHRGRIFVDTL
ncbi:MAG: DUF421 domain-containing protein [Paenibacillaceae bacterium]